MSRQVLRILPKEHDIKIRFEVHEGSLSGDASITPGDDRIEFNHRIARAVEV
jgi:hypothetical protein